MTDFPLTVNSSKTKTCFCPICVLLGGVLLPISTYTSHQKNAERQQQQNGTPNRLSVGSGSGPSGYSQTSSFVEELRAMMTPTNLSGLRFLGDPVQVGSYQPQQAPRRDERLESPFALAPKALNNREHLARQNRLRVVAAELQIWPEGAEKDEILRTVQIVSDHLEFQKALAWSRQRNAHFSSFVDTDIYYSIGVPHRNEPFLASCYMSTMLLSTFGSLTQTDAKSLLAGFRSVAASSPQTQHLQRFIPKDVRDLLSHYDVFNPVVHRYATCPTCFAQYPLSNHTAETLPRCTHIETRLSMPCQTSLWTSFRSRAPVPVLVTAVQCFKQWLGRHLSHAKFERACETAFQVLGRDPMRREADGTRLQDIQDDSGNPWLPGSGQELRLVFMWSTDGWNPLHNVMAGKARSSTGVWLVNMGLPLDVRYLPENVFFFCAIPGKPNGSSLNPTLELLVDIFLEFWKPGVWFSRTALRPAGRLVQAAVVPQVSDAPASRQASGRGAINVTEFCMCCMLKHDDIECSDRSEFVARDEKQQREWAQQWKNAPSEEAREQLLAEHDVRWTPLHRLPYHLTTVDNIAEPLHLFYKHVIEDCVRRCLRVHLVVDDKVVSEEIKEKMPPRPAYDLTKAALRILSEAPNGVLSKRNLAKLTSKPEPVLFHLCRDLGLRHAGFKRQLAQNLAAWRSSVAADDARLKPSSDEDLDEHLQTEDDSESAIMPSEDDSVMAGSDVSDSAHGAEDSSLSAISPPEITGPESMPWLKSLTQEEMQGLCTKKAETIRKGFNSRRSLSTLTTYCSGEKTILSAFAKMLSLSAHDAFRNQNKRAPKIEAIKKHLIEQNTMLPDVRQHLGPFLSTGPGRVQSGGFREPSVSNTELDESEKRLMTSPIAAAVSEKLLTGKAVSTILNAARGDGVTAKPMLTVFCKSLGLPTQGRSEELAERLKAYTARQYASIAPKVSRTDPEGPRRAILNTAIMLKIRECMKLTQLPTSFTRASLNWGTKGHGRVSGGDWLMIGTVHLPIVLIPLWGNPFATPHEKDLLQHVMTMATVVCLGTLRTISVADTYDFDAAAQKLFESKKNLFKDETIKPYDHLLLHYGEILRRFGPTPAHDGSFFERYIRFLHGFNTNMKLGEVEQTYMKAAGRYANLRSALLDGETFATLSQTSFLVEEFRRSSFSDKRGTKLGSSMLDSQSIFSAEGAQFLRKDTSQVILSTDVFDLVPPDVRARHSGASTSNATAALSVKAASYGGARLCPSSAVEKDSDMVYLLGVRDSTSTSSRIQLEKVAAGRIIFLFLYGYESLEQRPLFGSSSPSRSGTLWAVVRPYKRLSPAEKHLDAHYRAYEFGGFCTMPDFEDAPILVNVSRIVCQVAKTPVQYAGVSLIHFLPLPRLTNATSHFTPALPDLVPEETSSSS